MKSMKVNIVTPEKVAWEAEAVSVTIPGSEGYLGVWADHAALVSAVVPGLVTLKLDDAGSEKFLAVGAGFVEIRQRGEPDDRDLRGGGRHRRRASPPLPGKGP